MIFNHPNFYCKWWFITASKNINEAKKMCPLVKIKKTKKGTCGELRCIWNVLFILHFFEMRVLEKERGIWDYERRGMFLSFWVLWDEGFGGREGHLGLWEGRRWDQRGDEARWGGTWEYKVIIGILIRNLVLFIYELVFVYILNIYALYFFTFF